MDAVVMRAIARPLLLRSTLPRLSLPLLLLPLLLMCCIGNVRAQPMPDPTRPATLAPDNAAGVGAGAQADAPLGQLQSVLIGRSGRRVAVISGQTLRVGDKFAGAVLLAVSENSVQLKKGSKVSVLKLFPAPLERPPGAVPGVEP